MVGWLDGWMVEWLDGWMDGWMDRQTDGLTDGRTDTQVGRQDISSQNLENKKEVSKMLVGLCQREREIGRSTRR